MEEGERTRVHRGVLRGEVASSPEEAYHAVRFAESWLTSFWGRPWFRYLLVGLSAYVALLAVVRALTHGWSGDLLRDVVLSAMFALFAALALRRQRRVERSHARNLALLDGDLPPPG